jgi:hypothetical protein
MHNLTKLSWHRLTACAFFREALIPEKSLAPPKGCGYIFCKQAVSMEIQLIFFDDENRPLFQAAAGKRPLPVGEVGFGLLVMRLNLVPGAALFALSEISVALHFADFHGHNPRCRAVLFP